MSTKVDFSLADIRQIPLEELHERFVLLGRMLIVSLGNNWEALYGYATDIPGDKYGGCWIIRKEGVCLLRPNGRPTKSSLYVAEFGTLDEALELYDQSKEWIDANLDEIKKILNKEQADDEDSYG